MALARTYCVRCDRCGRLGPSAGTSKAARQAARRRGFKRKPGSASSGADYCPGCGTQVDGAR